MTPRPNVSEERTDQILSAATEVFAQKGFYKARMDDIAAQARLSKGTLYLYFKSKDAIILALLDRLFQPEMRQLAALHTAEGSASERLEQFVAIMIEDVTRWQRLVPVAYEFLGLIFRNKTVQQAFRRYLRAYLELLVPLIEDGIASGEFRAHDARQTALTLSALFEGSILLGVYDPESVDVARNIRSGMDLLLEGLRREPDA